MLVTKSRSVAPKPGCPHLIEWTGKSLEQQLCRLLDASRGCAGANADSLYRKSAEGLICEQNWGCLLVTPMSKVACDLT